MERLAECNRLNAADISLLDQMDISPDLDRRSLSYSQNTPALTKLFNCFSQTKNKIFNVYIRLDLCEISEINNNPVKDFDTF